MKDYTRREFLQRSAVGIASLTGLAGIVENAVGKEDPNVPTINQMPYRYDYLRMSATELHYRFYHYTHHFMTVIDNGGEWIIRPHPGVDIDGWGTSLYLQAFLAGASLNYTSLKDINVLQDGIEVLAQGDVSQYPYSPSDEFVGWKFGNWNARLLFNYNRDAKKVHGNGRYEITLPEKLSVAGKDLNLCKITSNYLTGVPLKSGVIGDTGDMKQVNVTGDHWAFTWDIKNFPHHYPQDFTNNLMIEVIGQYNNIDTVAQGFEPINATYKPSLTLTLKSQVPNPHMIFGGWYETSKAQDFSSDNIGITPLITTGSPYTSFLFDVEFQSEALPLDGADTNRDGKIDMRDVSELGKNFAKVGKDIPGDADGDGHVTFIDFSRIANLFRRTFKDMYNRQVAPRR